MNIVMFSETYLPYLNGAVTHIVMLREELEARGHKVYVVTVSDVDEVCLDDYVIRCPGHCFKNIYNYRLGRLYSPKRDRLIASLKPNIFHMHNEFSLGYAAVHLAKKLKVPLVYTLHTDYKRHIGYLNMPGHEKQIEQWSLKYLTYLGRRADSLISPSPKAREYLPEDKVGKSVTVLANAVDSRPFERVRANDKLRESKRQELGLSPTCLALVYLGRLGQEKSVLDLLAAFLHARLAPDQTKLFFIGDGPEKQALQEKIAEAEAGDQVFLLGSFPNAEIPSLLNAMDVYVSASLSEMHSISLLEATAAGLPALVRLDPANAWQIEEGKNGYCWADEQEFSQRLHELVGLSREEREELRQAAMSFAETHGIDLQVQELLTIYREALDHYQA